MNRTHRFGSARFESPAFSAQLTRCAGTWLAAPPDADERARIAAAARTLGAQRALALAFHRDPAADAFSIELFRQPLFAPLHLADGLVERMLARVGEPPVVAVDDEATFAAYLKHAVLSIAGANVRRGLAHQLRRTLPHFVTVQRWREAVAIDTNAFRTALGNEVTPFLAQMALAGLAHWYEAHDE